MGQLQNRINFSAFIAVRNANPNGDPLTGNMPRLDRKGFGEISAECVKRKLRNRMMDMGHDISVVPNDRATDGITSIQERVVAKIGDPGKDQAAYRTKLCEAFLDVRAFGGTFAWKGAKTGEGLSLGIRGPVTIEIAKSVDPVVVDSMQITKSTNGTPSDKRGSDTMGMRHVVEFGLYRVNGSINARLAELTGFSEEDAEVLKEALRTMFLNDESSARPAGSIDVVKIYWFEHDTKDGVNASTVYRAVHAGVKPGVSDPADVGDYEFSVDVVPGTSMVELV